MKLALPLLFLGLVGCAHHEVQTYQDVSIEALVSDPSAYSGRHVRVNGFLVYERGRVVLRDRGPGACYENNSGELSDRSYITTTPPWNYLGTTRDEFGANIGRVADVVGLFRPVSDLWGDPKHSNIELTYMRAAGPNTLARVERLGEERCAYSIEP